MVFIIGRLFLPDLLLAITVFVTGIGGTIGPYLRGTADFVALSFGAACAGMILTFESSAYGLGWSPLTLVILGCLNMLRSAWKH